MAEENKAQQEPQQITKKPQRLTTKDPKKVEAGKRLAAINHKKREKQAKLEKTASGVNQYYGIGAVIALGYRWSWLLHLSVQERRGGERRATFKPTTK